MKRLLLLTPLCFFLLGAAPGVPTEKPKERITKKELLSKDKLFLYTVAKPYFADKWKYFCCPVKKVVRRYAAEGKWTDYCYNAREELIGIYRRDARGSVKRSDFSSVPGCTLCGSTKIKQKSWRHNTRPGVVIPPKKKRR
ncbi:MAG: hypothetical protein E7048_07005 [Lentisphaerae bacterium]|nr:hypothetical protein [Lentisphaerota bacterium]MBR2873325.1 hypothetical protein [Lentisphaeria bacterium]